MPSFKRVSTVPSCEFCGSQFASRKAVRAHIKARRECNRAFAARHKSLTRLAVRPTSRAYDNDSNESCSSGDGPGDAQAGAFIEFGVIGDPGGELSDSPSSGSRAPLSLLQRKGNPVPQSHASMGEIPDEDDVRYVEECAGAATPVAKHHRSPYEHDFSCLSADGTTSWAPFPSERDWNLAHWAKTDSISDVTLARLFETIALHDKLHSRSPRDLNNYVDQLPTPPSFTHQTFRIDGVDEDFDCFYRNPLEIARELIGDPAFAGKLLLQPVRNYTSRDKSSRQFSEWNTADWAWEIQVSSLILLIGNGISQESA